MAGLQSGVEYKQFRLQRAQVELNPVFATTMHMADHQWGYVRLVSFSQHAPADMHRAISQLKVGLAGTGAWVGSSKAESRWFILLLHTHTRSATSPRCLPAYHQPCSFLPLPFFLAACRVHLRQREDPERV